MSVAPRLDSSRHRAPAARASALRRPAIMLASAFALMCAAMAVNFLANPCGVWRSSLIDPIYRRIELDDARVATPYLLRSAAPATVLIGTSRVFIGMPIEQICRGQVMNAALGRLTLDEISALVDVALRNPRLQRIVWAVDFEGFDEPQANEVDLATIHRLRRNLGSVLSDGLVSLSTLDLSRQMLARALAGRSRLPGERLAPVPWPPEMLRLAAARLESEGLPVFPQSRVEYDLLTFAQPTYRDFRLSARQTELFFKIVKKIRDARVELAMFLPPLTQYELEEIRQNGKWPAYQRFRREIAKAGPYWDFSGYNELARDDRVFLDVQHFKPLLGNLILRWIDASERDQCCGEIGKELANSAVRIDTSDVEQALAEQDKRMEANAGAGKYGKVVSDLRSRLRSAPTQRERL